VAAAVTGLVMDVIRKIESRCAGGPPIDSEPRASTCTWSPWAHQRHQARHLIVGDVRGRDGLAQDGKGISREGGPYIAWFRDPAGNILSVLQEG
jgi:hypothetical protein